MARASIEEWVFCWMIARSNTIDRQHHKTTLSSLQTYARRCDDKYAEVLAECDTLRQVRDLLRLDRDDMKLQRDLLMDALSEAACLCAPHFTCKRCTALERGWGANRIPSKTRF